MSAERITTEQIEGLVRQDLTNQGNNKTFGYMVEAIKEKSGASDDVFALANSEIVQIDLGVGKETTYRIHLQSHENGKHLAVWTVDAKGNPNSNLKHMMTSGNNTWIFGSSLGSIDGHDMVINEKEFAGSLSEALQSLNTYNWKLVL